MFISLFRRIKASWVLLILAPIIALGICLGVHSNRLIHHVPVLYYDEDHSALSRSLIREASQLPQIDLRSCDTRVQCADAFNRGQVEAVIWIDKDLTQNVRQGHTGHINLWRNAGNATVGTQLSGSIGSLIGTYNVKLSAQRMIASGLNSSQAVARSSPLRMEAHLIGNPQMDYLRYLGTAMLPLFFQMAWMLMGGAISTHLTWKQRLWQWSAMGIYATLVGILVIQVFLPLLGQPVHQPLLLLLAWTLMSWSSILFGSGARRVIGSQDICSQWLLILNAPAFLLSGLTFPGWAMPHWLEVAGRSHPFALYLDLQRTYSDGPFGGLQGWWGLCIWLVAGIVLATVPAQKKGRHLPQNDSELKQIISHPVLNVLFWMAPFIYLSLYSSVYLNKHETKIPLAVVFSGTPLQAESRLMREFSSHPRIQAIAMDQFQAEEALHSGTVRGMLFIPADLEDRLRRGESSSLPLWVLTDRFLPSSDLQRAVNEVLALEGMWRTGAYWVSKGLPINWVKERALPLYLDDHSIGNPAETYGDFMLPGLGILVLHQLLLIGFSYASAQSRRLDRNISRFLIWVPWFSIMAFVWLGFGLNYWQIANLAQWTMLAPLILTGMIAAAAMAWVMGMLLGRGANTQRVLAFSSYPFFFLTGYGWPLWAMPSWAVQLSSLFPLGPMMRGIRLALRGSSWDQIQGEMHLLEFQALMWIGLGILLSFLFRYFQNSPRTNPHRIVEAQEIL